MPNAIESSRLRKINFFHFDAESSKCIIFEMAEEEYDIDVIRIYLNKAHQHDDVAAIVGILKTIGKLYKKGKKIYKKGNNGKFIKREEIL